MWTEQAEDFLRHYSFRHSSNKFTKPNVFNSLTFGCRDTKLKQNCNVANVNSILFRLADRWSVVILHDCCDLKRSCGKRSSAISSRMVTCIPSVVTRCRFKQSCDLTTCFLEMRFLFCVWVPSVFSADYHGANVHISCSMNRKHA